MRTFRITLSHGDEHITFDGAGARSGSMFHVRRDSIEGLWSSPASKVSLTERETANGASPISDGETLYAARTVAIPFAIQSNYNHTDLIRARTLLGRLIGWHDVRVDINDDGDETVLYGYIEAKYSDIPYDHTDAGVITVVCPDPRRISKHESTISMNTSSSSIGGLSFGVPAYELAWTGTPNASTSTLSKDGAVVATNLFPNPSFESGSATGFSVTSGTVGYTDGGTNSPADGSYFLTIPRSGTSNATIVTNSIAVSAGASMRLQAKVVSLARTYSIVATYGSGATQTVYSGSAGGANGVWSSQSWTFTVPSGETTMTLTISAEYTIRFDMFQLCTQSDYAAMQSLGVDWFSGDTQSPQANSGLDFPLDFGQTGNTGNTGMIENNGSYTSMPTITAHGWLDGGLTIHWTTSDGNEGDLSFTGDVGNVPVTIKTDSHSAIMGGLDVSYQLGSRDWPRIPAGGSCSFALLASGSGWVSVQSHDTYM